ncbi:MAG TPA: DUF5985 family protein [Candidatus Baltobacteraceae bacterium]|jgi:uncharacterized membrane protein YoaK (UPF0700 family)
MYLFLSGIIAMGSFVAAVYFANFWRRTSERLLLYFAIAFALLALERLILAIFDLPEQAQPAIYTIRFIAFVLILIGIAAKNRPRR